MPTTSTALPAIRASTTGAQLDIPQGTCGQTQADPMTARRSGLRIVGGVEAIQHSIPWIVMLRQGYSKKVHFCGGTLIRVSDTKEESDIVLTAAHCNEEG